MSNFSLIVSNTTSRSETDANEIRLDFSQAPLSLQNKEVSLAYLGLYYSWRNITAAFGNNTLSYIYNGVEQFITLPDGFYTVSDLNNYLQFVMDANNHYVLDVDGNRVYFIELAVNETYYAVTFILRKIEVPAGGTNPFGLITGSTMQLRFSNAEFAKVLGCNTGTYPPAPLTSTYSFNSPNIPQVSPVTTVLVTTNISRSQYNKYSDAIYTFAPTSPYASFLSIEPNKSIWYKVIDGSYDRISLRFYDQNYRPLQIVDKLNITASLIFREFGK